MLTVVRTCVAQERKEECYMTLFLSTDVNNGEYVWTWTYLLIELFHEKVGIHRAPSLRSICAERDVPTWNSLYSEFNKGRVDVMKIDRSRFETTSDSAFHSNKIFVLRIADIFLVNLLARICITYCEWHSVTDTFRHTFLPGIEYRKAKWCAPSPPPPIIMTPASLQVLQSCACIRMATERQSKAIK
jgi:hypothetical protein